MIPGVNFQPGAQGYGEAQSQGSNQGVQEAIKVLSLRLPKVVGARSVAPAPLLTSQGAAGNPDVDSIVERVLRRVFPSSRTQGSVEGVPVVSAGSIGATSTDDPQSESSHSTSDGGGQSPRFSGLSQYFNEREPGNPWGPPVTTPQIIVGTPATGASLVGPNQRTNGSGPIIENAPDLRPNFDWLPDFGGAGNLKWPV